MEYRIKELNNSFTIEVLYETVEVFLFKRKSISKWVRADIVGQPCSYRKIVCDVFDSLDAAINKIDSWLKEPIYHKYEKK